MGDKESLDMFASIDQAAMESTRKLSALPNPDSLPGGRAQWQAKVQLILTEMLLDRLGVPSAVDAERKRCATIARQKGEHAYDDCECLGSADPETGIRECSLEAKGHDCLCAVADEMADEIATEIEGGKANG